MIKNTTQESPKTTTVSTPNTGDRPFSFYYALRATQTRYEQAFAHAETARQQRNAMVHAALAADWTHAQVAEVTGLTRGRVEQI